MESVDVLAEFYKHCLNVGGNTRPNGHTTPLWCGWMRCNITPYLVDGKVYNEVHPHFKEALSPSKTTETTVSETETTVSEIDNCGHMGLIEQPEAVAKIVRSIVGDG